MGDINVVHDQDLSVGELRVDAELGVGAGLGVTLSLPLRRYSTDIRYIDLIGDEVELTFPNIHHRDETLLGVGDVELGGAWRRGLGAFVLGVRAGASLPLGGTEPDPFALGDAGLAHEHFQFGTGTVDPFAGVTLAWRTRLVTLAGWAYTRQSLYDGGEGYRAGDRYAGGVSAESGLGLARWSFRAGLDTQKETAETWGGTTRSDEGNLGRVDVLLGVGAELRVTDTLSVRAGLRTPVYQHVVGGQIDMPVLFELGLAWHTPAREHHHDHGDEHDHHDHGDEHDHHDHGDEHDHHDEAIPPGVDLADLTDTGEAVELVPVPGKLTIFDFWAPWCQPCLKLSPMLIELARQHPELIAIRRINIVDWSTPAADRYLRHFGSLPHLKVYGPDGALLWERSAAPEALVRFVEDSLDALSAPAAP